VTQIDDHNANGHGVLAYKALLSSATATQGIFRTDGTNTVAITRDDSAPPTGGTYTLLAGPVINDRGQLAFKAEMTGGSTGFAIFRGDGADLTPVFLADQIVPGGATFQDFGSPGGPLSSHAFLATTTLTSRKGTIASGSSHCRSKLAGLKRLGEHRYVCADVCSETGRRYRCMNIQRWPSRSSAR
jgi:hypothetical protein